MQKEWVFSIKGIDQVSGEFVVLLKQHVKIFIYGEMGAGKTSFVKSLLKTLGSNDDVVSPTYSLVNEYKLDETGQTVRHLDLYRLKTIDEALDIGIEEYLDDPAICLIEWPEIIETLSPENTLRISISILTDNQRKLVIL
jgi:tRNA threonylcarbamoyladenosine biosynthesis protein TsaE